MNKRTIIALCVAVAAAGAFAKPHGAPPRGPRPVQMRRRLPPPVHHHRHHSHSVWGHGGSRFWPGFIGGVVGGTLVEAVSRPNVVRETVVVQQPVTTVVTAPVVVRESPRTVTQRIWVEGCYVDQVQANGTIIRVWQPGHYETRTVVEY